MPPSLSFNLPTPGSLTDKAAKFISNISTTFVSTSRNAIVRKLVLGHQFEATLVSEPTKCSYCNQLIWFPHGQRCKLCKLSSHMKCMELIETRCVREANCNRQPEDEHTTNRLKPYHKLKTRIFMIPSPTMCDHCGTYIILTRKYDECSLCSRNFHHDCIEFVSRECALRRESPTTTPMIKAEYKHVSKFSIEQFDILKLLGTGSYGKVYLARLKGNESDPGESKNTFAIKVIKKTNPVIMGDPGSVFNEWKGLNMGRSYPFLTIAHCCFQSRERLYFVMEYVEGRDLLYYVNEEGKFSENRVRFHSAEIVLALMYLHNQRVVYRDVKLNNIILDQFGHCKLIDFGMNKIFTKDQVKTNTICGTAFYISPEILRGEQYDYSVDWWSLGVLMYEMLCDALPFNGKNDDDLYKAILTEDLSYPASAKLSDRARSLLDGLLTKDPCHRLGCQLMEGCAMAIKEHDFFLFEKPNFMCDQSREVHLWDEIEAKRIKPPYIPPRPKANPFSFNHCQGHELQLTPIDKDQLKEISQSDFDNFSCYSESFDEVNCFS